MESGSSLRPAVPDLIQLMLNFASLSVHTCALEHDVGKKDTVSFFSSGVRYKEHGIFKADSV